jgi:hypothetical protein
MEVTCRRPPPPRTDRELPPGGLERLGADAADLGRDGGGPARVISDCHFAVQLNQFIPGLRVYLVAIFKVRIGYNPRSCPHRPGPLGGGRCMVPTTPPAGTPRPPTSRGSSPWASGLSRYGVERKLYRVKAQTARLGPTLLLKIPIRALKLAHNLGQPCTIFVVWVRCVHRNSFSPISMSSSGSTNPLSCAPLAERERSPRRAPPPGNNPARPCCCWGTTPGWRSSSSGWPARK